MLPVRSLSRHTRKVAAVTVAVTLGACGRSAPPADTPASVSGSDGQVTIPQSSPLRSALSFDTARTVAVSDVVLATASVESEPERTVKLYPPMAGRVVALHVQLGDAVTRGQPLITLDSPDFTSAQADYAHAVTALHQATNNLARERDLAKYGIAATRDVEQAETDFSQADGDYHRAASHLTLLGIDTRMALKDQALVLRSPIAGRVTDLSVGVGEFHNDPTVPVMTVADLGSVWLTANVAEKDVHIVKVGDRAAAVLSAYPTDTVHGIVSMVSDVVDTATRMTKVRVTLKNPGERLKPGMYATVTFAARAEPRVVVPATSLLQVRDSNYVFVETQPWTLVRRPVVIGRMVGSGIIVRDGLSSGQRIVSRQVVLLQ
ncbi:MAG TPA: efflux RND transporter periplasmic adaptor subunit [Gemmatimonadaceae bacterium]|nr:efflux RND transporter periplasmic adaptor subunit [Gemmatimonadaceae bacterium]